MSKDVQIYSLRQAIDQYFAKLIKQLVSFRANEEVNTQDLIEDIAYSINHIRKMRAKLHTLTQPEHIEHE